MNHRRWFWDDPAKSDGGGDCGREGRERRCVVNVEDWLTAYTHIHTHTYTYTRIHTHIHTPPFPQVTFTAYRHVLAISEPSSTLPTVFVLRYFVTHTHTHIHTTRTDKIIMHGRLNILMTVFI